MQSIVKRSVQESFELLNASGREMSESGVSAYRYYLQLCSDCKENVYNFS